MSKGRATATFTVEAWNADDSIVIQVTAKSDESIDFQGEANGIVALGKLVAELAKVANPVTARDRKVTAMTQELVAEGLSEERATELAESFVK